MNKPDPDKKNDSGADVTFKLALHKYHGQFLFTCANSYVCIIFILKKTYIFKEMMCPMVAGFGFSYQSQCFFSVWLICSFFLSSSCLNFLLFFFLTSDVFDEQ